VKLADPIARTETDAVRQNDPLPGALELHAQDATGRIEGVKDAVPPTKPTVERKNNSSEGTLG
jgi:hypothetical protein